MFRYQKILRSFIVTIVCLYIINASIIYSSPYLNSTQTIELNKVSEITTEGSPYDVWVDENLGIAYVTSGYGGLSIFNITDLLNPVLLSNVPASPPLISTGHSSGYAHQLFVQNKIVYIGDGPSGLTIVNCTDPLNPDVLSHWVGGYTWDTHIKSDIAYIGNGWNNIGSPGLMIINVSDPSDPVLISNFETGGDTTDVEVVENTAYVVINTVGLQIIDISNQSGPVLLGQYAGPSGSYAIDVEITGNLAFLVFWKSGIHVLNISDPANITLEDEYFVNYNDEFGFLSLNNGFGYIATKSNGVIVFNTTSPTLNVVGTYSDGGHAYGILSNNNYVFLADQSDGFKILEIQFISANNNTNTISSSLSSTSISSTLTQSRSSSTLFYSESGYFVLIISVFIVHWKKSRK